MSFTGTSNLSKDTHNLKSLLSREAKCTAAGDRIAKWQWRWWLTDGTLIQYTLDESVEVGQNGWMMRRGARSSHIIAVQEAKRRN